MNNDFIPTPKSSKSDATTDSLGSPEAQQISRPAPVVTVKKSPGKIHRFFSLLGLLLVLALAGGGVWYWQQMQIKDLRTTQSGLESQISSLKSKILADKTAAEGEGGSESPDSAKPSSVREIVTGNFVRQELSAVTVNALYLPGEVEEIWVEVGTKPGEMSATTKHLSEGLGAGAAGQYAKQEFGLIDLKAGTTYFYWTGAKVDGKTVYGGVSSFETAK